MCIITQMFKERYNGFVEIQKDNTSIDIFVKPYKKYLRICPICHKHRPIYDTNKSYTMWRDTDIQETEVHVYYRLSRTNCPECGVHCEEVSWAKPNHRFTKIFEEKVLIDAIHSNKTYTAEKYGISWRTVDRICNTEAETLAALPTRFDNLSYIGIDETSYKKGHKYILTVIDHQRCEVLWVDKGNTKETLQKFFDLLTPDQRDKIQLVTADGAKWIKEKVLECCPNAAMIMDKFHVTGWIHDALDEERRAEQRKINRKIKKFENEHQEEIASGNRRVKAQLNELKSAQKHLKNNKNLLLMSFDKLSSYGQGVVSGILQQASSTLNCAWVLKEELHNIMQMELADECLIRDRLYRWVLTARSSGKESLVKLGEKVFTRFDDIIRTITEPYTNARVEGFNTMIKRILRDGYGYRKIKNLGNIIILSSHISSANIKS